MFSAILATMALSGEFVVREAEWFGSAHIAAKDRAFFVGENLYTDENNVTEARDVQAYEISETGRCKTLLDARFAGELRSWVNKADKGDKKGYRLDRVVQGRYLITRAAAWGDDEKVRMIVIDSKTGQAVDFKGYTRAEASMTTDSIRAAGPGWVVVTKSPPFDLKEARGQKMPSMAPSRMIIIRNGEETEIGYGVAAGSDDQGRIYANDRLDADGKSTREWDPAGKPTIKVYENGTWRSLGEGEIRHVRSDGTLLVHRRGGYTFTVKDGVWTEITPTWDVLKYNPAYLADNGDILLWGRSPAMNTPMPGFIGAIYRQGKVTEFNDLFGTDARMGIPEMAPDGTVLVQRGDSPAPKTYLITPQSP